MSAKHLPYGTLTEISRLAGVNVHTVRYWLKNGRPPHSKLNITVQRTLQRLLDQAVKDASPSQHDGD